MGLKCQLLGHTYGNPEVERSREEQGEEVVVTVRNLKVCERCGDEQIVNQTKEVTTVRSPTDVGLETTESASTPADPVEQPPGNAPGTAADGTDTPDSPVTPVEPDAAGSATPDPAASPEPETDASSDAGADSAGEPGVEPAVDQIDDGVVADEAVGTPEDNETTAPDDGPDGTEEGSDVAEPADETSVSADATDDGWETGSDGWSDVDADIDDAVILDGEETHQDEVQWPEASEAGPEASESDPTGSEAEWAGETGEFDDESESSDGHSEDAEIIDTEGDATEWPTHDGESTGSWPDHDGTDEGYAAAPNADVDAEFDGEGLTPEVNGSATAESGGVDGVAVRASNGHTTGESGGAEADTVSTEADAETDEGFVRATESESAEADVPDGRVEFYCPNCGYAQAAGVSSMRAGDICPECKRGYIAEREA